MSTVESVTRRRDSQARVEIVPVASASDRRQFVEFAFDLYRSNAHWIPPLRRDEYRRLSPDHNPFLDHAEMSLWLAVVRGRVVVGRIAAIEDRLHNDIHHERAAWFGFFEARDVVVANALFAAVEQWARSRGSPVVRGPVNPSLNESAGLLIDGFDEDPFLLMPFNPQSYASFIEGAGYSKARDLFAWIIELANPLPERVVRIADRVRRRHGITVRAAEMRHFKRDLAIMQAIYRTAWEDNWGFVPPTDHEIAQLAGDLRPIIDPEMVLYAEMAGRPVACAVSIPDFNQVLKRMGGSLLPFGLWHFLRRRSIITQARMLLLGVLPEFRRIGLYPLLIAEAYRHALAGGYQRAELSWTLEDNDAVNAGIEAAGGRRYKTYRLYEKRLG